MGLFHFTTHRHTRDFISVLMLNYNSYMKSFVQVSCMVHSNQFSYCDSLLAHFSTFELFEGKDLNSFVCHFCRFSISGKGLASEEACIRLDDHQIGLHSSQGAAMTISQYCYNYYLTFHVYV